MDEYFNKKMLLIKRNNTYFYDGLLSPADIDSVLFNWSNATTLVKASKQHGLRQNLGGSVMQQNTPSILSELDEGSTLILDKLDNRIESMTRMCGILENELHYNFQGNVYITPPKSQGFRSHFDDHHVFILQTTGKKQWRVNNTTVPKDTPSEKALDFKIDEDNHQSFLLEQGDLIYIPPYTVHEAHGQDEYSIHITLSPYPPSWSTLLKSLLNQASKNSDTLDQPMPDNYFNMGNAELLATAKGLFKQLVQSTPASAIDTFKKEQADEFRGAFYGALKHRIESNEFDSACYYKLNESLLIRKTQRDSNIIINTPQKEVVLPDLFEEQIDFCLSGQLFQSKDIPNMAEEETEILIDRLLGEALICSIQRT